MHFRFIMQIERAVIQSQSQHSRGGSRRCSLGRREESLKRRIPQDSDSDHVFMALIFSQRQIEAEISIYVTSCIAVMLSCHFACCARLCCSMVPTQLTLSTLEWFAARLTERRSGEQKLQVTLWQIHSFIG